MTKIETQIGQGDVVEHRETESQGSRVVFYGYPHHELNLEGIPHIVNTFRAGLERQPKKATLFLETHYLPEANARHWEGLINVLGGLTNLRIAQLIAESEHKLPDREEIEVKRRALMNADFAELVITNTLPTKYVEPLYLAREIDALRQDYAFDIMFESHPPQVARTLEAMQTGSGELQTAAVNHFMQRDSERLMRDWKSHIQLEHVIKSTRQKFNLADLRRRLASDGHRNFIFVLAGVSHLVMADQFKASLVDSDAIEVEAASNLPYSERTDFKLYQVLYRGEDPEDELYAQDFIEGIFGMEVLNRLDKRLGDQEALRRIAHNIEKFYTATQRMASSLSFDQIREMCLDHDKVYQFIDQSIHAEPIREVLDIGLKKISSRSTYAINTSPDVTSAEQVGVSDELASVEGGTLLGENSRAKNRDLIKGQFLQREEAIRLSILKPFIDDGVLKEREALLLYLRFIEKQRAIDIAPRIGLTNHISIYQITNRILKRLPPEFVEGLRGGAPIVK